MSKSSSLEFWDTEQHFFGIIGKVTLIQAAIYPISNHENREDSLQNLYGRTPRK